MTSTSRSAASLLAAVVLVLCHALPVRAQPADRNDALVTDAREAFRKRDRVRLAALKADALAARHPLAPWVDYWELGSRLREATVDEVEAFYSRWPGSYVEDRLRNDWLLELGRRRDWANLARDYPRFRMNDDRSVTCYWLLTEHLAGREVRESGRIAWMAQPEADDGCQQLALALRDGKRLANHEVWRKIRASVDGGRLRAAQAAASLLDPALSRKVGEALDSPARFIGRIRDPEAFAADELLTLAIARAAASDIDFAVEQMRQHEGGVDGALAGWAWAAIAHQAAMALDPQATAYYDRAWSRLRRNELPDWGDDILGWNVRAALRLGRGADRWKQVLRAVDAMSASERSEPIWAYWKARALLATAPPAPPPGASGTAAEPEPARPEAQQLLESIASPFHFYGALALEELGRPVALPARPEPLAAAEQQAVRGHAGLGRALLLIELGLRGEGVREWNFGLRDFGDRQLLAAAQLACEREVWDRCINTSDRTKTEIDIAQRFPTPFRAEVVDKARAIGVDPAYVYGLIRQESRFILDARSSAGASGLMQLMPATARLTAKRLGIDYSAGRVNDREVNLRLGTAYLKFALDDFGGSEALAAAAYNAGPGRPRRWREGPLLEPAIWAENIPFGETRDYVKKVLSNASLYALVLGAKESSLKARLGADIGPAAP